MVKMVSPDAPGVGQGCEMIRSFLEEKGVRGKVNTTTVLVAEEAMMDLIQHADKNSQISVSMKSFLETIKIEISAIGEEYDFADRISDPPEELWASPNSYTENAIRDRILSSYKKNIKYKHKRGVNSIRLKIFLPYRALVLTTGAMVLAILAGLILARAVPAHWTTALNLNILTPVKSIFLKILKMLAAPVVFFSIASSISQMGSPSELGRVGLKVIILYVITTIIAVCVGIGVFWLIKPGSAAMAGSVSSGAALPPQTFSTSLKDIIMGIFPDNIITPFLETNMMQLIFLSVLCGLAIGTCEGYAKGLSTLLDACSELFMNATSLIMHGIPILVFCSILSMILTLGLSSLLMLLGMLGTFLLGLVCMLVVYSLLMLIFGINPLVVLKSYAPSALQVFSTASSNAAIPINMNFCETRLHILPKLYRFSIPLGATMNMDGMCVLLAVESLTLAKIFGVPVPGSMLVSLAISIILLSIGAPGVPGAGIIMVSMLIDMLGVPVEGVALLSGIGPIVGMFLCASNCAGDIAVTAIVAKNEKLIQPDSPLGKTNRKPKRKR